MFSPYGVSGRLFASVRVAVLRIAARISSPAVKTASLVLTFGSGVSAERWECFS
jgi:hypothetical protein